jgi:hypothetical protein
MRRRSGRIIVAFSTYWLRFAKIFDGEAPLTTSKISI